MHEINLYQTPLTEGQWSYINKEFLENDRRKRKYSLQSVLKLSSTYWSAAVNGEGCLTTIPRGKVSIITTINGDKRVVSSISLRNSSERYVANAARHQVRVLARWMPKVSDGVADRGDNGYDGNKKVKGVKRNIITDRNGFILARKVCNAGIHDSKMAHDLCGLADDVWEDLRKVLSDRGYRGDVDKDIEKTSASSLRHPIPPMELRDSCQSRSDGWLRGLSHGLTLAADSPGTMRY